MKENIFKVTIFIGAFYLGVFLGHVFPWPKVEDKTPDAKMLVLASDTVVKEVDIKAKFLFIVFPEVVYYLDSSVGKMWGAAPSDLSKLSPEHQIAVKKALKAWE